MEYDIESVKAEWLASEKTVASLMDSLESVLARFREGLKTHSDRREKLDGSLGKVLARKKETVRALDSVVKKIDKLSENESKTKHEYRLIKLAEKVANTKYEEILSGNIPSLADPEENNLPDTESSGANADLAERKKMFLEHVNNAFDDLDARITELKKRKETLTQEMDAVGRNMKACQLSRGVLARKLEMYKTEAVEFEKHLKDSISHEAALLGEYTDFIERFKGLLEAPGSVEKLLSQTKSAMEPLESAALSE